MNTYAAIIGELSDELAEAEQQCDRARAELDRHLATVTVIAPRQPRNDSDVSTCS